jgi:hypothetical protein
MHPSIFSCFSVAFASAFAWHDFVPVSGGGRDGKMLPKLRQFCRLGCIYSILVTVVILCTLLVELFVKRFLRLKESEAARKKGQKNRMK